MLSNKPQSAVEKIQQDRRQWLGLLAKGGALVGLVNSSPLAAAVMANRLAEAQPTKKFILLYHPGGAARQYLNTIAVRPFDPFGDAVAALTMTISRPGSHGNIYIAAGANVWDPDALNSSTIDQQIAATIGHLTPLHSMQLGVFTEVMSDFIHYKGASKPSIDAPEMAVRNYFGRFSATPSNGVLTPYDRREIILAAHQKGLDQLINRVSSEERFKLEQHVAAIEHYQTRLEHNSALVSDMGLCGKVVYTAGNSPLNMYRAQGDIAVTALACGLTNVASIQFNNTHETWLANDGTADAVPVQGDMLQVLNGGQEQYFPALNEYMNKGVAHIINKLKLAGIFQDTVLLCVSEMGDSVTNTPDAGPITVASGISGFKGGRRNLTQDHYTIFPDIVRLMGLEWAINQTIYNYHGGGIVV